jgi:hypothetical protein
MKKLIIATVLSLMTSFVYSQNCIFEIQIKTYKNISKKISLTKRKNISFFIKTNECLCVNNIYTIFNGNKITDGYLIKTENVGETKIFHLLSSDYKTNYEIIIESNRIVITEEKNGNKKVFVSEKFNTKWLV